MRFSTVFFDLDDTLYPSSSGLWPVLKLRMSDYMRVQMGFPPDEIPRIREKYFLEYGTTLRGLQANHTIDVEDYLAYVHAVPLEQFLTPNPLQRRVIASLGTRNIIFTNADAAHARRVLAALELDDLFQTIIDVNAMSPHCKPMPESFEIAMKAAGEPDPRRCVMIDDLPHTTRAARHTGLFALLYGSHQVQSDADGCFTDWNDLPDLLSNS
jgi:putative hydrolase of the HAD superfamily